MDIKIGERLKELRKSKGWTQVQVAAKMGLTDSVSKRQIKQCIEK